MPKVDSSNPQSFGVNFWVFKDDESETEAKTNSGHRVCPLLACTEHALCSLLARHVSTHTHTHTRMHTHITSRISKKLKS